MTRTRPKRRTRTSRISGPAHHRISADNACFYRRNANSGIAVTPKVTPPVTTEKKNPDGKVVWRNARISFGSTAREWPEPVTNSLQGHLWNGHELRVS